jgi:hypothetical protein
MGTILMMLKKDKNSCIVFLTITGQVSQVGYPLSLLIP